jgi:hypothetical protein
MNDKTSIYALYSAEAAHASGSPSNVTNSSQPPLRNANRGNKDIMAILIRRGAEQEEGAIYAPKVRFW